MTILWKAAACLCGVTLAGAAHAQEYPVRPLRMLVGYTPELTQAAYRIGDSVSNVVSPMMSYFALIVAFVERYDKKAGIGTVIATMLPYSVAFLICWSLLLLGWMALGLPVGPGAGLRLAPAM